MKRLLLLVAVLCLAIVPPVIASCNFQSWSDGNIINGCNLFVFTSTNYKTLVADYSPGGTNGTLGASFGDVGIGVKSAYPGYFTYLAYDQISSIAPGLNLYDADGTTLLRTVPMPSCYGGRAEMVLEPVEGVFRPNTYCNAVYVNRYANISIAPSFVYIYSGGSPGRTIDNLGSENGFVGALPVNWTIVYDVLNPAATGVYAINPDGSLTLKNSNAFIIDVSVGSTSIPGGTSRMVETDNFNVYAPNGTSIYHEDISDMVNHYQYSFSDFISRSGNSFGKYSACLSNRGVCDYFWLTGAGASILFDKDSYNSLDTASITYLVTPSYWDTATYTYSIVIQNANTGEVMSTNPISSSSGTITYTFPSSAVNGMYYALFIATKRSDGTKTYMSFDYANLVAYAIFTGYVNDAATDLPIANANVSMVQGSDSSNNITDPYGFYSNDGSFQTGLGLLINTTATGYSQYYYTIVPLKTKTNLLNITLNITTPAFAGKGITGVVREGLFTAPFNITQGYGNPTQGVLVSVVNTTTGEHYTKTTGMAGGYLCSETENCILTSGRPYNVSGSKVGYNTSPFYRVVIP